MTGKTITGYLEKYRAEKSLSLVQSGQYSMVQIADMTGFSNPSCFVAAFRKRFGNSLGAIQENIILLQMIIREFLENNDSGIDFDDTDIDIKERKKNP